MLPADYAALPGWIAARGLGLGRAIVFHAATGSTNDDAKQGARDGAAHGSVWLADAQSQGRGRQGRQWESPPGENLLGSVLLRGALPLERVSLLTLVTGLAVRQAVALQLPAARVQLKWPNDVLVEGKKVAGVLVEAQSRAGGLDGVIVGFGVNVRQRSFDAALALRATSLALAGAEEPSRAQVLLEILAFLDAHVAAVLQGGLGALHAELQRHDALRGQPVRNADGAQGVAEGIATDGALRVRELDGGLATWRAGEVHLLAASGR